MRLIIFVTILILTGARAFASASETIPVHFSEKQRSVSVNGRIIPGIGALHLEVANARGKVAAIFIQEGLSVNEGAPLARIEGKDCVKGESVCTIKAAHTGTVTQLIVERGSTVGPGDSLATVLDPQELSVRLDIPVKFSQFIWPGQAVAVRFPQISKTVIPARIAHFLPTIGTGETTRGARLDKFKLPPGTKLESVVSAEISIPLNASGARVPAPAVAFARGRHYVLKQNGDTWMPVPVQIVSENENTLWVLPLDSGKIKDGDLIMLSNTIFFLDGLLEQAEG